MKDSKVHHCISQEMVAQGLDEPPARKCNCREKVTYQRADQLVKNGEARWVVIARERGTQEQICPMCGGDQDVKNCAQCTGTGKITVGVVWDSFKTDIVLVSQAAIDKKERKYRPALALKTPRVATIEEEHIELAYVEQKKEAEERIEEYGRLILEARAFIGKDKLYVIIPEPENNAAKGEGRDYDYGRPV
jgi:hypothetical protein